MFEDSLFSGLREDTKSAEMAEILDQEQTVSPQGMRVLKAVELVNHMPGIGHMAQNGELRKRFTAMEHHWNIPEGLALDAVELSNSRLEWLSEENRENAKPIVLQLHGGGYYGTMHNTYRDMAALYRKLSGGVAASLDYRVAPEHPYPAAFEDAIEA